MSRNWINGLALTAVAAASAALIWSLGPLPQDPAYHLFADRRELLGIPNFWNLISNAALVLAAGAGLAWMLRVRPSPALPPAVFFTGALLSGLGSAWYHSAPDTGRLVWDRLGMAIAFAGFLALVIEGSGGTRLARRIVLPLALLGVASVIYWYAGELSEQGDLRPYAMLQFAPLAVVPLALILYPGRAGFKRWIVAALSCYALAKLCELADGQIFAVGHWLSGHTLKHLWAGAAALCTLEALGRTSSQVDDPT